MPTDVTICSSALILVGAKSINSFDDASREARVASSVYTDTYQGLLLVHPWRFSIGQATLAQLVDEPLYGYEYAYQLPSDCLQVLSIENNYDYSIYENHLYCDSSTVKIEYQFKPEEVRLNALFVNALKYELGTVFAMALLEDMKKAAQMQGLAQQWLNRAKLKDSQSQSARKFNSYVLLNARMSG